MTSRTTTTTTRHGSRNTSSNPAHGHTGVRRNLFHGNHLRRPTTSSTTSTSATTLQSPSLADEDNSNSSNTNINSADIVVRDQNGNYEVEVPLIPVERQEEDVERQREDARLADAVKHHTRDRNRTPSEPAELLAAVQASLRSKVASLQEDNWMFEGEEELF